MPLKDFKIILVLGIILLSAYACDRSFDSERSSAVVYVEESPEGFRLIRNNEPFYIKGAGGTGFFEELKRAGGNTIRLYDTIDLEKKLNEAHDLGLAVVVDIPLPEYDTNFDHYEQDLPEIKKKVVTLVSKHKDHPALLYWMLGNELFYPTFYRQTNFFDHFNELIHAVKDTDPNHPVSTAVIGGNRRRLASIIIKSPDLDFVSINTFGSLTNLKERMESIGLLWKGPYVISEWGINGPWEEEATSWGAPIEPTSTKKAEILEERTNSAAMQDPACLGSFAFYWGNKQERTPTWFSIFSEDGKMNQSYHEISNFWNGNRREYHGPELDYALLNKKGAPVDIVLSSGKEAHMEILFQDKGEDSLQFTWEIQKEAWDDIFERQPAIKDLFIRQSLSEASFIVPEEEGPYRIYYYAFDKQNNFATTNIPFYVLNAQENE